jgi:[ribosomal protein S5]-alanine N-acetyltransferase
VSLPVETERLVVREFTAADARAVARAFADPEVIWWEAAPFTLEAARAWVARSRERYAVDGVGLYAVALRAGGRLIGDCGLVARVIEGTQVVEIGWHLERASWGHGYATEAARAVLKHAVGLGITHVCALIVADNVRSRGVARRLGMTIDRQVDWAGRSHDLWVLGLTGWSRPGPPTATTVLP